VELYNEVYIEAKFISKDKIKRLTW